MEKIVYSDSWHKYFSEIGLESFDDFFNYSSGRKVNENNKRSVITFETETGPQKKQFFLKRFFNPHLKDMFFTWRNLGRLCSQGAYEWANANFLLNNGIKTYKPVCRGELTKFGIERKSFIVTEKLQGQSMESFVAENWSRLKQSQKEEIIIIAQLYYAR